MIRETDGHKEPDQSACKSNLSFAITCHTTSHTQHILESYTYIYIYIYTHTCHMCHLMGTRREQTIHTTQRPHKIQHGSVSYTFFFSLVTNFLYIHSLSIIPWHIQQHTFTVSVHAHIQLPFQVTFCLRLTTFFSGVHSLVFHSF